MIKLITTKEGTTAVLKNDTHLSRWVEEKGTLRTDGLLDRVLPMIRPGDYVVDCGANIGDWTVPLLDAVGPAGLVYAFEPMPITFACLAVNTRNYNNVKIFNCGLSADTRFVEMESGDNAGAASILGVGDLSRGRACKAMVRSLDEIDLPRVDFMKVDVEGHELPLLYGSMETIRKFMPEIVCELNRGALSRIGHTPDGVVKFMHDMGYRMEFADPSHTLDMPQIDVFFFPK